MLPVDDIRITIDGEAVTLRPTLRAAYRLEKKIGFRRAFDGVQAGNLSIVATIIEETATTDTRVPDIIRDILKTGIVKLDVLRLPLLSLVYQLVGVDPDQPDQDQPKGTKPTPKQSLSEFFTRLFEFATGNLGWTPDQAWNASPAEIIAAQRGRQDLLQSIFGKPDKKAQVDRRSLSLSQQANLAIAGLGGKVVKRSPKAGA